MLNDFTMRDIIIQEIRRLAAANEGQVPGQKFFENETGIASHQWRGRFWARWSDALSEAGFAPNQLSIKSDIDNMMRGLVIACRHYKHIPTGSEMEILRRSNPSVPHPNVIRSNLGGRSEVIESLLNYTSKSDDLSDIAEMLSKISNKTLSDADTGKKIDGYVYLIKSGNFYKIGRSDNAERRFKQISIALPEKSDLFHVIRTDDPSGIEAYWHRRFANRRMNGEWFKLTSQDVAAFKRRKFQ